MALINITFGEKNKASKNKTDKSTKQDKVKKVKRERKPIQYTKVILNMTIFLTMITTLASIYINFKNGLGLDGITASCWEGLKYIIPSYCAKSFFESKEENKNKLIEKLNNITEDVERNE